MEIFLNFFNQKKKSCVHLQYCFRMVINCYTSKHWMEWKNGFSNSKVHKKVVDQSKNGLNLVILNTKLCEIDPTCWNWWNVAAAFIPVIHYFWSFIWVWDFCTFCVHVDVHFGIAIMCKVFGWFQQNRP